MENRTEQPPISPIMRALAKSRMQAMILAYIDEDYRQLKWLCDDMTPAETEAFAATLRRVADYMAGPAERTTRSGGSRG